MSVLQKYKKSLEKQWCLRLKTRHPEGDNYDGVVVHLTSDMIALSSEEDFEFDGIEVFPRSAIKGYRDGKFERCCNKILQHNGQIKRLRPPRWLKSCTNIADVILYLKKHDIWPGVEVLFEGDTDSAFYIGPITETDDAGFELNCYDAAGEWERIYKIQFNEVFRITFNTKYCKHFNAYMRQIRN